MTVFRKILTYLFAAVELPPVLLRGLIGGAPYTVGYLRNPNPLLTPIILRAFGARIGKRTTFKRAVYLDNVYEDENSAGNFSHLEIGANCFVGDCVFIDLSNRVRIRDNVVIAGRASILTHADCNRSPFLNERFPRVSRPTTVEEGAWIGFGATLLAGVTVGENAVVGAGSLVTADVVPKTVAVGSPARVVRTLDAPEDDVNPVTGPVGL